MISARIFFLSLSLLASKSLSQWRGTRLEPKIYLRLVRLDSLATLVAKLSTVLLILEPNRPQRRRKIDTPRSRRLKTN